MINKKLFHFVLVLLGSFVGQLYVRIVEFDGSLDHWWMLIPPFSLPPVSVVPAYIMYKNKIKKGQGGYPFDIYMFIPIICITITGLLLERKFYNMDLSGSVIKFIVCFFSFFIAFYLRDRDVCVQNIIRGSETQILEKYKSKKSRSKKSRSKKSRSRKYKPILKPMYKPKPKPKPIPKPTTDIDLLTKLSFYFKKDQEHKFKSISDVSYTKILCQTALITSIVPFLPFIITWLAYVGPTITTLGSISPIMGATLETIAKVVGLIIIYILLNMYNGRHIKRSCRQKIKTPLLIIFILMSFIITLMVETGRAPIIPFEF